MSLISRGKNLNRNLKKEVNNLKKFAEEAPEEASKTLYAIKGAIMGAGGAIVKGFRALAAVVGGTVVGSIMTGLGYEKKDIFKLINSPLESWWETIKTKWSEIPKEEKEESDISMSIYKGMLKAIFIGVPLGLGSGLLALVENTLSAVWTLFVGGWLLGLQAANLSKKIGDVVDNSSIFSGIARTNIFGTFLLAWTKFWKPEYGEQIEAIRKEYPNAIDYVREKINNLMDVNADKANNLKTGIQSSAANRTDELSNRAQDVQHALQSSNRIQSDRIKSNSMQSNRIQSSNSMQRLQRMQALQRMQSLRTPDDNQRQKQSTRFQQHVAAEARIASRIARHTPLARHKPLARHTPLAAARPIVTASRSSPSAYLRQPHSEPAEEPTRKSFLPHKRSLKDRQDRRRKQKFDPSPPPTHKK